MHPSRHLNCWSLSCTWSIACRRCSNYIFILYLTPSFNRLGKGKCIRRDENHLSFGICCVLYQRFYGNHNFCFQDYEDKWHQDVEAREEEMAEALRNQAQLSEKEAGKLMRLHEQHMEEFDRKFKIRQN